MPETDSAQTLSLVKKPVISGTSSAGTSRQLTVAKYVSITPATETDQHSGPLYLTVLNTTSSASVLTAAKYVSITPAVEFDQHAGSTLVIPVTTDNDALPLTAVKYVAITPATETDNSATVDALIIRPPKIAAGGLVFLFGDTNIPFIKSGSVISSAVASGAGDAVRNKTGLVISAFALSGIKGSSSTKTGVVIRECVLSGVSFKTNFLTKAGIVTIDSKLTGKDLPTFNRKNAVISQIFVSSPREKFSIKTGRAISAFSTFGSKTTEFPRAAIVISAFVAGGDSVGAKGEVGTVRSAAVLAGKKVRLFLRTILFEVDSVTSAKFIAIYTETGKVISARAASGIKARSTSRTGRVITTSVTTGSDAVVFTEFGTMIVNRISMSGGKVCVRVREGQVDGVWKVKGFSNETRAAFGTAISHGSELSGVKLHLIPRTGKVIATSVLSSNLEKQIVRAAIVKMDMVAIGHFEIDFNDDPELFERTLLEVTIEAPVLLSGTVL